MVVVLRIGRPDDNDISIAEAMERLKEDNSANLAVAKGQEETKTQQMKLRKQSIDGRNCKSHM